MTWLFPPKRLRSTSRLIIRTKKTVDFPYLSEHQRFRFPTPEQATEEGIVCSGGNLSPGMLLSAYSQGLFPWFSEGDPILWWSPDPRFVLYPENLHVPKSLKRTLNRRTFEFTVDAAFDEVITACKTVRRRGQKGTWITDDMWKAYRELHRLGYAHSVEAWSDDTLAGGLYGISLGKFFFGESMFSIERDASKASLVILCAYLQSEEFVFIDCQDYTPHISAMGAGHIPRSIFLDQLEKAVFQEAVKGDWGLIYTDFADRGYSLTAGNSP